MKEICTVIEMAKKQLGMQLECKYVNIYVRNQKGFNITPLYARPQHSCTVIYRLKIHKILSLLSISMSEFIP
jgi:hypothetical protein